MARVVTVVSTLDRVSAQGVAIEDSTWTMYVDRFGEIFPESNKEIVVTAYHETVDAWQRLAIAGSFSRIGFLTLGGFRGQDGNVTGRRQDNWKKYYEPARITQTTHHEVTAGEKIIKLDPKAALNSEPTTKMSLFALEQSPSFVVGKRCDVGTGSVYGARKSRS